MESWGLVVHDEQTFLAKVVSSGIDEGVLTADRVDEIIRISVAMANKYVLQKEIDFRSHEELAKVQETIIKLIGIGLEIRSRGDIDEGVRLLLEQSPVDLFRLAYTRIEKLRERWKQLLIDHRVEILVRSQDLESLSELTRQQLMDMNIFTEAELYTIRSLTMEDNLFTSLGILEYYEAELERYELILNMRDILPFSLLNRSRFINLENLTEVDSIRVGLINTIVMSAVVEGSDPVTVSMEEVRRFLSTLDLFGDGDIFPQKLEDVVIDLIQELAEGLSEREAELLAKELVETARKLVEIIVEEWDAVSSSSEMTFFKRWSRMAILSDAPDSLERVLTSDSTIDDFDFEILAQKLATLEKEQLDNSVKRIPWKRMTPDQIVGLFERLPLHQALLAHHVSLGGFSAENLADLLDTVEAGVIDVLVPALKEAVATKSFTLEELELLVASPHTELFSLLWNAHPPADMDAGRVLLEFKDGTRLRREVLLASCMDADFFPELFSEAWDTDAALVKRVAHSLPADHVGPFLSAAVGGRKPEVTPAERGKMPVVDFRSKSANSFFRSLPASKKRSALRFFTEN
jgi:hypothetical protein